jgi:hypothetical protein
MDARELKIGNHLKNGIVVTIQYREGIWGCLITQSPYSSGHDWEFVKEADLKPIELTEDWLNRFGFKVLGGGLYEKVASEKQPGYIIGFNHPAGENHTYQLYLGRIVYSHFTGTQIEYVHQLQNLWQILTGEELTLKETI